MIYIEHTYTRKQCALSACDKNEIWTTNEGQKIKTIKLITDKKMTNKRQIEKNRTQKSSNKN